jgi:thiopurine S-methyltransferase
MEPEFWQERWQKGQIGFHLPDVNPRLVAHRDVLPAEAGARVLVPLCGKSLDLTWLAGQGYEVVGVELSDVAAQGYFGAEARSPRVEQRGPFTRYSEGNVSIYCGNFFDLTPALLGPVQAFYDRAALVALPPAMRKQYVQKLSALLPDHVTGLAVCFEYAQSEMNGPPFAVPVDEVHALYEPDFAVELLATYDILADEPRFRAAGLRQLLERVYRLRR